MPGEASGLSADVRFEVEMPPPARPPPPPPQPPPPQPPPPAPREGGPRLSDAAGREW